MFRNSGKVYSTYFKWQGCSWSCQNWFWKNFSIYASSSRDFKKDAFYSKVGNRSVSNSPNKRTGYAKLQVGQRSSLISQQDSWSCYWWSKKKLRGAST
jgi:hypothetical protein